MSTPLHKETNVNLIGHTPFVTIGGLTFNNKLIPTGSQVYIYIEDINHSIEQTITAVVEYNQQNENVLMFTVPESFYLKDYPNRNVDYKLVYDDGVGTYYYEGKISMNTLSFSETNINLSSRTPTITATTVSYDDRINPSVLLPEGTYVTIELYDETYWISKTITAIIDGKNELNFQVPDSFYKENNIDREISILIKYKTNNVCYEYSTSTNMNPITHKLNNVILKPNTPTVNYSNLYLITNGMGNRIRAKFKVGDSVEVRLFDDDNNLYSSLNVVIKDNGISFVVPSKFYMEGYKNRNIRPVIVGYHEGKIAFGISGGDTNGNIGDYITGFYSLEINMNNEIVHDTNVLLVN